MDKKIAGLEGELRVFKDKMKKARSPAARKTLAICGRVIACSALSACAVLMPLAC